MGEGRGHRGDQGLGEERIAWPQEQGARAPTGKVKLPQPAGGCSELDPIWGAARTPIVPHLS